MKTDHSPLAISHKQLTIGWLYPDLMSTYGDRGNIITIERRCGWRAIETKVIPIDQETKKADLEKIDLIFGGGAQDREQEIVMRDLKEQKGEVIRGLIEKNVPALFVCGAPQLMGKFYEPAVGKRIEGLGIFDMESKKPGPEAKRLIGNIIAKVEWKNLSGHPGVATTTIGSHTEKDFIPTRGLASHEASRTLQNDTIIVGFENHGGRTYLRGNAKPFAIVIKGNGNNGEDATEGVVYKNAIGCYFHGPLLPKNPEIADWLIKTSLKVKYQEPIELSNLDDSLENRAREAIARKLGVRIN